MKTQANTSGRTGRFITPPQTADEYGIGLRHQKFLRQARRLPFIKVGHRCVLYDRLDVERFILDRRVEAVGTTTPISAAVQNGRA